MKELSYDKKRKRRSCRNTKRDHSNTLYISASKAEEDEIIDRAQNYAINIYPDPSYYILPSEASVLPKDSGNSAKGSSSPHTSEKWDVSSDPDMKIADQLLLNYYPEDTRYSPDTDDKQFGLLSKCHLSIKQKHVGRELSHSYYVMYRSNVSKSEDCLVKLPEGTILLKPESKLVEIVAQSIDGSPDGLLQVKQIYTVVQNRYPFFCYMDKSATNSWRSSIRHALYQKWFRKVKIEREDMNKKGCFWAINRNCEPREWIMPSSNYNFPPDYNPFAAGSSSTSIANCSQCYHDRDSLINVDYNLDHELTVHAPCPVYEPDPILNRSFCTETILFNDEINSPSRMSDQMKLTPTATCDISLPLSQNEILNLQIGEE